MESNHPYRAMHAASDTAEDWRAFVAALQRRFAARADGAAPLYSTASGALWALYLDAAPAQLRRSRDCSTCRKFMRRFGHVVTLDEAGKAHSVLWSEVDVPAPFAAACASLAAAVERAPVTGVFLSDHAIWGTPDAGDFEHLSITPPRSRIFASPSVSVSGARAAYVQDRTTLARAISAYPLERIAYARALVTSEQLFRAEKVRGPLEWLGALHRSLEAAGSATARENLLWRAAATAPPGFCHVRSSMAGALLDDLAAGLEMDSVRRRFAERMHPLRYQRPQAAPRAGNVAQAERLVAALESEGALARRFARLSDVRAMWTPSTAPERPRTGVFSHLPTRGGRSSERALDVPERTLTWVKFAAEVLPHASAIALRIPGEARGYMAMVTARDPNAKPILQWDHETERNPTSYYVYVNGSRPGRWNLEADKLHRVTAIVRNPAYWRDPTRATHHGDFVCLVLEGARDLPYERGAGFFPEMLRSEYHPIRATMEAFAKRAVIEGAGDAEVCGLSLHKDEPLDVQLIVTVEGIRSRVRLDRWD
jgi:hypothetical protein